MTPCQTWVPTARILLKFKYPGQLCKRLAGSKSCGPRQNLQRFFISFALFSWNTANYDECEGDLSLVIVIVYLECPAARVTSGLSMTLPEHIQLPRGIVINFPLRALSTVALTCQPMPPNMATLSSRPHCDR